MSRTEQSYRLESKALSLPFVATAVTSFVSLASQEHGVPKIPFTSMGLAVIAGITAVGLALEKARCDRHTV